MIAPARDSEFPEVHKSEIPEILEVRKEFSRLSITVRIVLLNLLYGHLNFVQITLSSRMPPEKTEHIVFLGGLFF